MKDRLYKFSLCLIAIPVLYVTVAFLAVILPLLPILALIKPQWVKINKK